VIVSNVDEAGPAERAGLRVGDVIVGLDTGRVERAHKLRWQVAARGVGKSVVLSVRRGNQPLKLRVKLEELPTDVAATTTVAARRSPPRKPTGSRLERVRTDHRQPKAKPAPADGAPDPAAKPAP
jgi:serine protease Do